MLYFYQILRYVFQHIRKDFFYLEKTAQLCDGLFQKKESMLKIFIFSLTLTFLLILSSETPVLADTMLARPSATLSVETLVPDDRVKVLTAFLAQYNSPFVDKADVFIREADRNKIDWKLLVAISGVESTFGQAYPRGTFNAWGWGIYGTNTHGFTSWDDAITTISKELKSRYIDGWGAQNVYQIGHYYAASPTWASRVTYFMDKIGSFTPSTTATELPISL